jgi:hypothetical protein
MLEIIHWILGLTTFGLVLINGLTTVNNYRIRGKLEARIKSACSKCGTESEDGCSCINCDDCGGTGYSP